MTDTVLFAPVMLGVTAAAFAIARSPVFWFGLAKMIITAAMPDIVKAIRPKNFTKKQRDQIAKGEDPFSIRPFGRQEGE